jgi:hypothetical protein
MNISEEKNITVYPQLLFAPSALLRAFFGVLSGIGSLVVEKTIH